MKSFRCLASTRSFLLFLFSIAQLCARCHAFGRPVVVQLDSRHYFEELDPTAHTGRQFTRININGNSLICGDAATGSTRLLSLRSEQDTNKNESTRVFPIPFGAGRKWNEPEFTWTPESQMMRYLLASKMAWLMEQCFLYKSSSDTYWVFDICLGRTVYRFHQSRQISLSRGLYNSLGLYDPSLDELYANGTIVQHYTNGTDGARTKIILECGINQHTTVTTVIEKTPLNYEVVFMGSTFCDWRQIDDSKLTSEEVQVRRDLDPAQLLHGLEGWCSNITMWNWWSYEYCHPDSLIQFHIDQKAGTVDKDNIYLLGALYPFEGSYFHNTKSRVHSIPSPSFVRLRSPSMVPPQPGDQIRWKLLPMELIDAPTGSNDNMGKSMSLIPKVNILDKPLKAISMALQPGTMCPHGVPRRTTVIFTCPSDFMTSPENRIARIREIAFCNYELHISTPLVCAHPELLHQRTPQPETVICYPESRQSNKTQVDRKSSHPDGKISEQGLDDVKIQRQRNFDSVAQTRYFQILKSPELLPSNFNPNPFPAELDTIDAPRGVFGLGHYIRRRLPLDDKQFKLHPNFRVGDVIRHISLDINGVIIGWDYELRAPAMWVGNFLNVYPNKLESAFYTILIDEGGLETYGPLRVSMLYSPEHMLRPSNQPIQNQHLTHYFSRYDQSVHRYVIDLSHSDTLLTSENAYSYQVMLFEEYPDDDVAGDRILRRSQRISENTFNEFDQDNAVLRSMNSDQETRESGSDQNAVEVELEPNVAPNENDQFQTVNDQSVASTSIKSEELEELVLENEDSIGQENRNEHDEL